MKRVWMVLLGLFLAFPSFGWADEGHDEPGAPPEQVGEVAFVVSCDPAVQERFNRAVALLHSFWYDEAKRAFEGVAEADPACSMAHWGVAMTLFRPLWGMPDAAALKEGSEAIGKAAEIGTESERERGYIGALSAFYRDFDSRDHRTRILAYEAEMESLVNRFPDDREATIFYALALNGAALPTDPTHANQKKAGSLLEPLLAEMPNHPGIAHYLIHSYDTPGLADGALSAARAYAKIAPSVPHALHMPSHIFTRLGLWRESIDSNLASAKAAEEHAARSGEPGAAEPKFHAMDYLMYAYLQQGRDAEAKTIFEILKSLEKEIPKSASAAYASAAIPTRYYLERHRWAEALSITARSSSYPWTDALIHFARAVGAARSGKIQQAQFEIKKLGAIRDALKKQNQPYWADQVEVQRRAAEGWLFHAKGENGMAMKSLRAAADLEERMEKHPVTPGPLLPAREMLGEFYLALSGRFSKDALASYEAVLAAAPNRFNALAGAARAAKRTQDLGKARSYYEALLTVAGEADGARPELKEAKAFLAKARQ